MSNTRALFAALLVLAARSAGAGISVTLQPGVSSSGTENGDTFMAQGVGDGLAANNYGGAGALAVAAAGSPKGPFSSVLRFATATGKSAFDAAYGARGWRLSAASLQLTTTVANNPIFNPVVTGPVQVLWMADDTWTEGSGTPNAPGSGGLNWKGFPTLLAVTEPAGMLQVENGGDGVPKRYPLTVGAAFTQDVAADGSVGFALLPGDAAVAVIFNSRSFGTASRNPALVLTAEPVLPEITSFQQTAAAGAYEMRFSAPQGLRLVVQSSPNLADWSDSAEFLSVEGVNTAQVQAAPDTHSHYWRLKRLLP